MTLPAGVRIRAVALDDAEDLARLHVDVWEDAYRDLMPATVFEERRATIPERVDRWRRAITEGPARTLVAESSPGLVGFASVSVVERPVVVTSLASSVLWIAAALIGSCSTIAALMLTTISLLERLETRRMPPRALFHLRLTVLGAVATIALAVLVDPKVALITDDTIEGRRSMDEMKAMAVLLMAGTFFGTLFSQVLFRPAAYVILLAAKLVGILFG